MGQVSNGAFYIGEDGFTVLQHKSEDLEQLHNITHGHQVDARKLSQESFVLHSHAYKVSFLGSNKKAEVIPDKPLYTYNNYFIGNDPSKWATECKLYQAVTVKDIYPNIDVRYYSDHGTMKYDIMVRPGGDVSDIAMKYDGMSKLDLKNRELRIATTVGELKELQPYTFQYKEDGKKDVQAKYSLKGNVVRFSVKDYDPSSTLVIDPVLVFCSFSGSTSDNWGFTATYGPDGSMYGGGIVFGSGFPVLGAAQTSYGGGSAGCFGGGFDIGIIKLTPNGSARVYATYIGGAGNEMPQSLIVDGQGELIVAGRTNSPLSGAGAYPITSPVIGKGGSWDITLTKLSASGAAFVGSRRIGGISDDGANITPCGGSSANSLQRNYGDEARSEVNLDGAGNVYLASCTQSTGATDPADNFPVTASAFQTTPGKGQDGVVMKFSPDLSNRIFSSYLGGDGNDAAYVLSLNPVDNRIYVAGGTESNNLKGSTGGTIGPSNQGGIDGFVSIISNDGSAVYQTTYLGTSGADQVYGLKFDRMGFPYVMGQTTGSWKVFNAPWSQPNGKQFIAKLKPDLSDYVYSTVFGKGGLVPDISPVAFLVDRCENVYVSGWGGSIGSFNYPNAGTLGLSVTPDAIKSTTDTDPATGLGQDFYFFVLKKDATAQLYGSFFGQNGGLVDHVDGGTSRFDENGVIYQAICANCTYPVRFPTTPGAWSTTKPTSANCNLAMVKIAFNLAGVGSGVQSYINGVPRDTAGCVPLTVDFKDTLQLAKSYEWNFGDGSPQITTTTPDATHTYTAVGTYRVMLVAIDSSTCNMRDTSYMNIKVGANKALVDFTPVKLNPCDSFKYRFDNISVPSAGFTFKPNGFTWDFGDGSPTVTAGTGSVFHNYTAPGTYTVKLTMVDSSFCNSPETVTKQVRVASIVKARFKTPPSGCVPYEAQFENLSDAGSQFAWNFGDGGTSNSVSPTHLYTTPGTYTVTLTAIDSATCNVKDDTTMTITVHGIPVADFTATPQPPVLNSPISFNNTSSADAVRFKWLFGDGDSLVTTSRLVIQHEYNATAEYNACLVAYNQSGCADTACKLVRTLIEPALDVPNAFTPLSGDVNSKVFVRGFGIAKMTFTVWARWGEKVFETNDKRIGWDGHYKGKLLPMDVYAYTLDAEFSDGTKTTRKGDITLIR